ncbi:cytochrome c oxidase subunit IVB [Oceanobacillus sp. CAU 1775]
MTENTSSNKINSYRKQANKDEMKKMIISFGLMIAFTVIAFALVGAGQLDGMFAIPLLLIMAVVQVGYQFFYFMHLKDKGHQEIAAVVYGAVWVTFLVMLALGVITWW